MSSKLNLTTQLFLVLAASLLIPVANASDTDTDTDTKDELESRVIDNLFRDATPSSKIPSVVDKKGCLYALYDPTPGELHG